MKAKKLLSILLAAMMVASFAACGNSESTSAQTQAPATQTEEKAEEAKEEKQKRRQKKRRKRPPLFPTRPLKSPIKVNTSTLLKLLPPVSGTRCLLQLPSKDAHRKSAIWLLPLKSRLLWKKNLLTANQSSSILQTAAPQVLPLQTSRDTMKKLV